MAVPGVAPQNAVTLLFLRVALLLGTEQVQVYQLSSLAAAKYGIIHFFFL